MMKKLGVVGCGLRSDGYLYLMREQLGKTVELTALADPNPVALETFINSYGQGQSIKTFSSGPEMLKSLENKLDTIIICSPNSLHLESFFPAMDQRLAVLLEKPVATSLNDCKLMWNSYIEASMPPVMVGFVLRYTPFFTKVKNLIDSGEIGQMLTVQAEETLAASLTAVYVRGGAKSWRSFDKHAGSFILEKCCHDFDILNYLIGSRPSKISSFATRTRFVPNRNVAMHCKDCYFKDCKYSAKNLDHYLVAPYRAEALKHIMPGLEDDFCVFNSEKDVPDHQIVSFEYENGVLANFCATMDQQKNTRVIKINGSEGQIIGDLRESRLELRKHKKNGVPDYDKYEIKIEHDNSGHDGGDSILTKNFKDLIHAETSSSLAGLKEGIEACIMAFAAETSRKTNSVVDVTEMFEEVFQASCKTKTKSALVC